MSGVSRPWLVVCGWLLTALVCSGQLTNRLGRLSVDLPMPPPSHVLDVGGLFDRYPEQLAEISKMLRELEDRHEVPVYLVVYAGLLRGGVTERATEFFDTWIGVDRDGLVVVCDADAGKLDLGLPMASPKSGEEGGVLVSRLTDAEIIPISMELQKMLEGREDPQDYLVEMTRHLTTRLDGVLSVPRSDGLDRETWMIGGLTLLVTGVVLMVGWFTSRRLQGAEERAREQFFFPDVLVGVRLGAQYGGGRVAVKTFGKNRDAGEE